MTQPYVCHVYTTQTPLRQSHDVSFATTRHTHLHTISHIHVYTYIHSLTPTLPHTYIYMYTHIHTCIYIYICVCVYTCVYITSQPALDHKLAHCDASHRTPPSITPHTYSHTLSHIYTYTYTYTHTYIHTHIHTCICVYIYISPPHSLPSTTSMHTATCRTTHQPNPTANCWRRRAKWHCRRRRWAASLRLLLLPCAKRLRARLYVNVCTFFGGGGGGGGRERESERERERETMCVCV